MVTQHYSPGTGPIVLADRLDTTAARALAGALRDRIGQDLHLDASAVTHLGGLCLQVLLAAGYDWRATPHRLQIAPRSDAFDDALRLFGTDLAQCEAQGLADLDQSRSDDAPGAEFPLGPQGFIADLTQNGPLAADLSQTNGEDGDLGLDDSGLEDRGPEDGGPENGGYGGFAQDATMPDLPDIPDIPDIPDLPLDLQADDPAQDMPAAPAGFAANGPVFASRRRGNRVERPTAGPMAGLPDFAGDSSLPSPDMPPPEAEGIGQDGPLQAGGLA